MEQYLGFKELTLTDNEIAEFYSNDSVNIFKCKTNEYVAIYNTDGKLVDKFCWDGRRYSKVGYPIINNRFVGKVKPRNLQQQFAIDMLYNNDITIKMLSGRFGSGKTFLMCAAAVDLIQKGDFEKIVYVRNNIEVKNTKQIGHLPGTYNEKMLPFCMPLCDHLGGVENLERMIGCGEIEVVHLGFIRGRDIKNSIIICSEAENLTKEHLQLLIGRVGTGSALWLDGDVKQIDMKVFEDNNGMKAAVEKLSGHPRFGYVKLLKTERSETAAMADLLD